MRALVRRVAGYMEAAAITVAFTSARYLDTNPRVYMRRGLAYLGRAAPGGGLPAAAPAG